MLDKLIREYIKIEKIIDKLSIKYQKDFLHQLIYLPKVDIDNSKQIENWCKKNGK